MESMVVPPKLGITLRTVYLLIPICNFIMRTGTPHMRIFLDPAGSHMGTPRMRTGISFWCVSDLSSSHVLNQNFYTGIKWIPICIRGLHVMRSPYAYGDLNQSQNAYGDHRDPRMHTGIAWHVIPVCIRGFVRSQYAYGDISVTNCMHTGNISIWEIKSCIPICIISHTEIAVCIWGSPYANVRGSLKSSHMGIPVRIMKLCAYGD